MRKTITNGINNLNTFVTILCNRRKTTDFVNIKFFNLLDFL